ncbi:linear amide C-N hydrolase [uncultured Roseobacter sp.]|uniref:linear amide C-N hydrolase n=1 Tax=uncultured Roseobacter sp. TaxID=114847 RepID=UPI00262C74D8|nr:linear amide C-N hydrolase [uncultured Roseobacter sp.]
MVFRIQELLGKRHSAWSLAAITSVVAPAVLACSTMALGPAGSRMIAYSYDTSATGAGYVFVNPRGGTRTSIMEDSTARWPTEHGSVTFNQMGFGMPTAGMNTAGLFVSLMWNDAAAFPATKSTDILNELELIQLLLDRAASVEEAVTLAREASVQAMVPIHYFVADATGATAALTPTRDGISVHLGRDMPVPALTNSDYDDLLAGLATFDGFGGRKPLPVSKAHERSSLNRFVLAAHATHSGSTDGFAALEDVKNDQTRWQIVASPTEQTIQFTLTDTTSQGRIVMGDIDFSCHDSVTGLNLENARTTGDTLDFTQPSATEMTDVLSDVLAGFADTIGMPLEWAGPIVKAQMGSFTCPD